MVDKPPVVAHRGADTTKTNANELKCRTHTTCTQVHTSVIEEYNTTTSRSSTDNQLLGSWCMNKNHSDSLTHLQPSL
jgi:hypothetical protein